MLRTAVAALAAGAAVFQVRHMTTSGIPLAHALGLFTIQSNTIAAGALLLSPIAPRARGAAATYLTITATVYALLLGGIPSTLLGTIHWDDAVLHEVVPAFVIADWWLRPSALPGSRWRWIAGWMLYPLAYLAYTLLVGARTGWYPYGFLAARQIGYPAVAIISAILTTVAVAFALVYVRRAQTKTARIAASRFVD